LSVVVTAGNRGPAPLPSAVAWTNWAPCAKFSAHTWPTLLHATWRVLSAATGPVQVIGANLLDLFTDPARLRAAFKMRDLKFANPVTVTTAHREDPPKGATVNVILQRNEDGLLVDMER
jgi:hypothetical protein